MRWEIESTEKRESWNIFGKQGRFFSNYILNILKMHGEGLLLKYPISDYFGLSNTQ